MNFTRLDEGMQFFLSILESHPHIGSSAGPPKEVEVSAETLALIKSRDRPVEPVTAFKRDRCIGLAAEWFSGRIEKILLGLEQFEIRIERHRQRLGILHLVRLGNRSGARGECETKAGQQNSHHASIKREERTGVNRRPRAGGMGSVPSVFLFFCSRSQGAGSRRRRARFRAATVRVHRGMPLILPVLSVQYERGVYLPDENIWLDPWDAKPFAFVSHAHSDHIASHDEIIVSERTARLMQARLPGERHEHVLPFGVPTRVRGLAVTLLPAGHIFGSAQFFLETGGGSLLYTGDFKLRPGRSAEATQWKQADTLIMETTYGLPRYRLPPTELVVQQIVAFCREALEEGATPVLLGYSLGKAQEILCSLAEANLRPMLHGSVYQMTRIYEQFGQTFCDYERYDAKSVAGKVSDLSAERESLAHAGKNSKKTRRDDQRLGGRAQRDLPLSGRRRLSALRPR